MKGVIELVQATDVSLAGGKGAALARLIQAGFNVPAGFVVTTAAKMLNKQLTDEVLAAFDTLGVKYVAVRSSAAAEDGAKDAWAGQLDTFLNVPRDELLEKIRLCWKSAQSDRAKSYAQQKGLQSGNVAVVVQTMVQSEVSGIGFSVNPISKDAEQMIIEAGFGLNEPIVSGEITPDTYIINKSSLEAAQKHVSRQEKQLSLGKNGKNQWQKVKDPDEQKLSDKQINEVARAVLKLEEFFGFPVDVEWTYADDELFILQSRPITTLS